MSELLWWSGIFVVSLVVLIKAADFFTESAVKIGRHFKLSPFVIGVTIVALGTSLPELISSLVAVFQGASEIVVGNVVGSNITNIFLILGFAAVIGKTVKIKNQHLSSDLALLIGSAALLTVMIMDGEFGMSDAILSLCGLAIYFHFTFKGKKSLEAMEQEKTAKKILEPEKSFRRISWQTTILIVSGVFIYLGAQFLVDSVLELSGMLNIGGEIIAITAVALGTSLPELVVTIAAARQGHPDLAIGNVLGSNIFNTFAVMGIPALFGALIIPTSILAVGLPMMIIATFIFYFFTHQKELHVWGGYTLLLFYAFFLIQQISMV